MGRRDPRQTRGRTQFSGPFKPTQIPGCVLWLRGDQVTLDGSNNVQTWPDLSGSGNNFAQATPGARPSYSASGGPNGTPALGFVIASQLFMTNATLALPVANSTIAIVQKFAATSNLQFSFIASSAGSTNGWGLGLEGAPARRDVLVCNVAHDLDQTSLPTTSYEKWVATCTSSAQTLRVNGSAHTLNPNNSVPVNATTGAIIGQLGGGGDWFGGNISEIIAWNNVISAASVVQLEAYLFSRYGL